MGKPIAGRDKFPFGIDGIQVEAVKTENGIIKNVFISKQRSSNVFDLITKDGELIEFVEIASLPVLAGSVNVDDLELNTFVILGKDVQGTIVGCVEKILKNVVNLFSGEVLPFENLSIGVFSSNDDSSTNTEVTPPDVVIDEPQKEPEVTEPEKEVKEPVEIEPEPQEEKDEDVPVTRKATKKKAPVSDESDSE